MHKLKSIVAPQLTAIGILLDLEALERGDDLQRSAEAGIALVQQLHVRTDVLRTALVDELASRQQLDLLTRLVTDFVSKTTENHCEAVREMTYTQSSLSRLETSVDQRLAALEG